MNACRAKNIISTTRFLDARQLALVKQLLAGTGCNNHTFDGGIPDAERIVCIFMPDYPTVHELFKLIRADKSKQDILTHRDYLGSLMGLGIKREYIGDILVHDGGADIVVLNEIADFLMLEYNKAGRKQLSLRYISADEIKSGADDLKTVRITVSSMRLDAITGAIFNLSRSDSAELIKKGRVLLNSAESVKPDKIIDEGDKITIRGRGKAEIIGIIGRTKKDRLVLKIKIFGKR